MDQMLAHRSDDGLRCQTVLEHLEGTADLAAQFAAEFGCAEQGRLAGLLHDIGKYSAEFQARLNGGARVDHSTAGMKVAVDMQCPEVAFAIAGHHSGLPNGGGKMDPATAATFFGRWHRDVPDCSMWKNEVHLPNRVEDRKVCRRGFDTTFYTRMLYSCLVDADFLDTEAFMKDKPVRENVGESMQVLRDKLLAYVEPWWSPTTPVNEKRCEILRACIDHGRSMSPGLFTLTVPTGGGKTVSSLAFALEHAVRYGKRRVVYVIPYTSIIDQTADVFGHILGEENVLEHHSSSEALLSEDQTDEKAYRKVLAAENWDMPVVVTTAVQFFESLFANRSSKCRKLHNLANSVIIFDEAQTLPPPYLMPCVGAISALVKDYGVSAVLCTATQPALEEMFRDFVPNMSFREIAPDPAGLYEFFKRTQLITAGEYTEELLGAELAQTEQVLCVVNRRATAQQLYENLPEEGRYCLTTLICPADRKEIIAEIKARLRQGLPCRVVSTSLIEAGVDVDFPQVWREEAGLDSILQTAGRCNREGKNRREDSPVRVFTLKGLRVPSMLSTNVSAAAMVLRNYEDPSSPEAIEAYFNQFRRLKGTSALDEKQIVSGCDRGMEGSILPFATIAERFHLIETPARTIYIDRLESHDMLMAVRYGHAGRTTWRKLGQYGVTVYPKQLEELSAVGAVERLDDDSWMLTDVSRYDSRIGLNANVEFGQGFCV